MESNESDIFHSGQRTVGQDFAENGDKSGQITSITDGTGTRETGRSVTYTYDSLYRLSTAVTTGGNAWGLAFGYDVWANLHSDTVTQGSAPMLSVSVTTKNQMPGFCYDSAGNLVLNSACPEPPGTPFTPTYNYDAENRMTSTATTPPFAHKPAQRADWIRAKAPFAFRVSFG